MSAYLPIIAVILAGGEGKRLAACCPPDCPKPFAPLIGGKSLLHYTLARCEALGLTNRLMVAQQRHNAWLEAQAETTPRLLEPAGRNTAAAIISAAMWVARHHPNYLMLVMPADHWLPHLTPLKETIEALIAPVAGGAHGCFGITPDSASPDFGYLALSGDTAPYRVTHFHEKPDSVTAALYCQSGYVWNSGMFLFNPDTLLAESLPGMAEIRQCFDPNSGTYLPDYAHLPGIPIDRLLFEQTDHAVAMRLENSGWSDIGTPERLAALQHS